MSLAAQLLADYQAAVRAGDAVRVGTLRLLRAAIRDAEIDQRHTLADDGVLAVIQKQVKQRKDSVAAYRDAGRTDLAEREEAEMAVLQAYLPAGLSAEALRELAQAAIAEVGATSASDLGRVMKALMPRVRGQADGGEVNAVVRELLGA